MKVIQNPEQMQQLALQWRAQGQLVGFVPTMGYLHEGHLSLFRIARQAIGPKGQLVVSIFVNPTQFGPNEDYDRYPRDLQRDLDLCQKEGVDVVFTPSVHDMYPPDYSTYVVEEQLSQSMEGRSRPTHFRGVTTIVAKLFQLVLPTHTVFGAKDYQQAKIVQRMIRDLHFPIQFILGPTVREPDGLAMSSRNTYLTPQQRQSALCLWRSIQRAKEAVRAHPEGIPAETLRKELTDFIHSHPETRLDYIAFFDPETLQPHSTVRPGTHMALAVFVGSTRLIDNDRLE